MNSPIRHAVILAAGRGMRMAPLTNHLPKPMAPFQGSTLIENGIRNLVGRVPNIHITVGYKKAMLARHVIELGVSSVLNTEGKGNAWWLFHSLLRELNEPIYVLTCDNIVSLDFDLLERSYHELGAPACMLVPVKPVAGLEGDYIFREGSRVTKLDRKTPNDIYCSGIQVIHPGKVRALAEPVDDFYALWSQLIERGQLHVSPVYPDRWITIDTFEQLQTYSRVET